MLDDRGFIVELDWDALETADRVALFGALSGRLARAASLYQVYVRLWKLFHTTSGPIHDEVRGILLVGHDPFVAAAGKVYETAIAMGLKSARPLNLSRGSLDDAPSP